MLKQTAEKQAVAPRGAQAQAELRLRWAPLIWRIRLSRWRPGPDQAGHPAQHPPGQRRLRQLLQLQLRQAGLPERSLSSRQPAARQCWATAYQTRCMHWQSSACQVLGARCASLCQLESNAVACLHSRGGQPPLGARRPLAWWTDVMIMQSGVLEAARSRRLSSYRLPTNQAVPCAECRYMLLLSV